MALFRCAGMLAAHYCVIIQGRSALRGAPKCVGVDVLHRDGDGVDPGADRLKESHLGVETKIPPNVSCCYLVTKRVWWDSNPTTFRLKAGYSTN